MKYFEVEIIETTNVKVIVEAESAEEAELIAYEKCCDGMVDMGLGDLDIETNTIEEVEEDEIPLWYEVLRKEDDENETN